MSQELNKYQGNLISIFIRGPLDLLLYYIILYLATTKNTFQTYSQGCLWFLITFTRTNMFVWSNAFLQSKCKWCIHIWKNQIGRLFEYKTQRTLYLGIIPGQRSFYETILILEGVFFIIWVYIDKKYIGYDISELYLQNNELQTIQM